MPKSNHFVYTNNPAGGLARGDLAPIISAAEGHRQVAEPLINFIAIQLGINKQERLAIARE